MKDKFLMAAGLIFFIEQSLSSETILNYFSIGLFFNFGFFCAGFSFLNLIDLIPNHLTFFPSIDVILTLPSLESS